MTTIQTIVERAKSDKEFAYRIKSDPNKALAPYRLSPLEINKVIEEVKKIAGYSIWPTDR